MPRLIGHPFPPVASDGSPGSPDTDHRPTESKDAARFGAASPQTDRTAYSLSVTIGAPA